MNATVSKQEAKEAYIESVINKITVICEGFVKVPSSAGVGSYVVTIVDGKATDCGCPQCYGNGEHAPRQCKHRDAVNLWIARQQEVVTNEVPEQAELIVVATPEVEEHVHRCGGCGCDLAMSKNCTTNFCLWNSWYTEGLRNLEDERIRQEAKRQRELVAA